MGHVGVSEYKRHQGERVQLAITGYDPRDLLRGRYLRFRYTTDRSAQGPKDGSPLCYVPTNLGDQTHKLWNTPCEEARKQRVWVDGKSIAGPQKYFIPESVAPQLEREFVKHGGSIEVRVLPNGQIVVLELLIKGIPWRQHLTTL